MELNESVALVTGGAKGLGFAIATYLAERGAKVSVVDLDAEAIATLPPSMTGYVLDVTNQADAKSVVNEIVQRHGRVDILVNNAGVIFSEPFVNIMNPKGMMHDYERFQRSIKANLDSVFIMTSSVVEKMILLRTKGVVVSISSISACGNEGQTAYSAAKAGVNAMTRTWSKELGRMGIRCNAVAPGFIDSPSMRGALNEATIKHILSNTPLRRFGRAEDVAQAVASVITNDFINGVVLDVDGGLTI